jgi:hypothetical protein
MASTLKNQRTGRTWSGEKSGKTFKSKEIKLDFDITGPYTLDGKSIKVTKQSTDNMYQVVLDFEEI